MAAERSAPVVGRGQEGQRGVQRVDRLIPLRLMRAGRQLVRTQKKGST